MSRGYKGLCMGWIGAEGDWKERAGMGSVLELGYGPPGEGT